MLSRRGFRRAILASIAIHVAAFLTVPLKGPVGEARDLVIKRVSETAVKFVRIVKPPPAKPKVVPKPISRPRYAYRRVRRIVHRPVPKPRPQPEQPEAAPQPPPEAALLPPEPVQQPEKPVAPEPQPEPVVVHPTPPEHPVSVPPRLAEAPLSLASEEKPAAQPSQVPEKAAPEAMVPSPARPRITMAATTPTEPKPAPIEMPVNAPKPSPPAPAPALADERLALLPSAEQPLAEPRAEAAFKAAPPLPGAQATALATSPLPAPRASEGTPEAPPVRLAGLSGRGGSPAEAGPQRPVGRHGTGGGQREAPSLSAGEAPAGPQAAVAGTEKGAPGRPMVSVATLAGPGAGRGEGEGNEVGGPAPGSPLRLPAMRPGSVSIRPGPGGDIGYVLLPPGGGAGGVGGGVTGEAPGAGVGALPGSLGEKGAPGRAGALAALPGPTGRGGGRSVSPGTGLGGEGLDEGTGRGMAGRGPDGGGAGGVPAGGPQGLGLGGLAGSPGAGPGVFGLPGGGPGAPGVPGLAGDVLVLGPPGLIGGGAPGGQGFGAPLVFDKGEPGALWEQLRGPLRVALGGPATGSQLAPGGGGAEAGKPVAIAFGGPGGGLVGFGLPILPDTSAPVVVAGVPAGVPEGVGLLPGSPEAKGAPGGLYVGVSGSFDLPMGVTSSDYQTDSPGMVNLLAEVRARTNVHVTVQERFVPLTLDNIRHLPVLHLRGHRAFSFTPQEREALRQYVAQGGTIFAEDSHGPFGECLRRELKKIFGVAPKDLPPDHEVYRAFYVLDDIPVGDMGERYPLQGIAFGDRLGVIFSRNDYGDCWEGTGGWVKPESREPAFKMGVNIFLYIAAHWKKSRPAAP